MSDALSLKANDDVRAATRSPSTRTRASISSSESPSEKYSLSPPSLMSSKGFAEGQPATGQKERRASRRGEAHGPAFGRRGGDDLRQLAGGGISGAYQACRGALVRPCHRQRNWESCQTQHGHRRDQSFRQVERRNQNVCRLQDAEHRGAVHGRDLEDLSPLELGEEPLVDRGFGHGDQDRPVRDARATRRAPSRARVNPRVHRGVCRSGPPGPADSIGTEVSSIHCHAARPAIAPAASA